MYGRGAGNRKRAAPAIRAARLTFVKKSKAGEVLSPAIPHASRFAQQIPIENAPSWITATDVGLLITGFF
jgi:hypothetical protein